MTERIRTQREILTRIKQREKSDPFGFETGNYFEFLTFEIAKPFLKDTATEKDWGEVTSADHATVSAKMQDYMEFAWGKANNCRGLSASRSIAHMIAWSWLISDELGAEVERLEKYHYSHYGKGILAALCEHHGWDWQEWDNGRWTNNEEAEGQRANDAYPSWKSAAKPSFGLSGAPS